MFSEEEATGHVVTVQLYRAGLRVSKVCACTNQFIKFNLVGIYFCDDFALCT